MSKIEKIDYYQQGDVLIKPIKLVGLNNIPENAKKVNNLILAKGEATGHAHSIPEKFKNKVTVLEIDNKLFIKALEEIVIEHQEHDTFTIPAGDYWIDRVNEDDHFTNEARKISD